MHLVAIGLSVGLLLVGYVCLFSSLNEQFQIQHEINLKLPQDKQFEPTFWSFGSWNQFKTLQKELLPDSPRPHRFQTFRLAGFALLLTGMLVLAFTLGR